MDRFIITHTEDDQTTSIFTVRTDYDPGKVQIVIDHVVCCEPWNEGDIVLAVDEVDRLISHLLEWRREQGD